jgi:hypothetical protein
VGIPRYLATAATADLDRVLRLADELSEQRLERDRVGLVECGRPSPLARQLATQLTRAGRFPVSVLIGDRELAQSDSVLRRLSGVSSVWVFAENLFDAYMSVFATELTFAMRRAARQGLPVVGVGAGAVSLGGLLVARRVCAGSQYDLVTGLGWAPRVLLDGGHTDETIVRDAVCSLPGLLGIEIGSSGGVKVIGGQIDSIGDEPVGLLGADGRGGLISVDLAPGQRTTIAPPPLAPFTRELLSDKVQATLKAEKRPGVGQPKRAAPPPSDVPILTVAEADAVDAVEEHPVGRVCSMCHKVHEDEEPLRVELAA